MKKTLRLIGCIGLTLAVGGVSGVFTVEGVKGWYRTLNKPFFNPPDYLFGPVWTLLYALMGVSLFFILGLQPSPQRKRAIVIFATQMILNFFSSIIFFSRHAPGWALVEIAALWGCILYMIISFYRLHRVAGALQWPYMAWVSFASLLNGAIVYLN